MQRVATAIPPWLLARSPWIPTATGYWNPLGDHSAVVAPAPLSARSGDQNRTLHGYTRPIALRRQVDTRWFGKRGLLKLALRGFSKTSTSGCPATTPQRAHPAQPISKTSTSGCPTNTPQRASPAQPISKTSTSGCPATTSEGAPSATHFQKQALMGAQQLRPEGAPSATHFQNKLFCVSSN